MDNVQNCNSYITSNIPSSKAYSLAIQQSRIYLFQMKVVHDLETYNLQYRDKVY
jgi:hypothetical protein